MVGVTFYLTIRNYCLERIESHLILDPKFDA